VIVGGDYHRILATSFVADPRETMRYEASRGRQRRTGGLPGTRDRCHPVRCADDSALGARIRNDGSKYRSLISRTQKPADRHRRRQSTQLVYLVQSFSSRRMWGSYEKPRCGKKRSQWRAEIGPVFVASVSMIYTCKVQTGLFTPAAIDGRDSGGKLSQHNNLKVNSVPVLFLKVI
jgi:hypothetical protein